MLAQDDEHRCLGPGKAQSLRVLERLPASSSKSTGVSVCCCPRYVRFWIQATEGALVIPYSLGSEHLLATGEKDASRVERLGQMPVGAVLPWTALTIGASHPERAWPRSVTVFATTATTTRAWRLIL